MGLTDEEKRIAERARRRDEFAKAALTGLASDRTIEGSWDDIAVYAVRAADALLAALDATARKDTPGGATAAGVGAPRGFVLTAAQRGAVALAASLYRDEGSTEVADELYGLLDAIDAAKGGGA